MADWGSRADRFQDELIEQFWSPRRRLFRLDPGRRIWPWGSWNYWWQAHALHVMVDRYARCPGPELATRLDSHLSAILRRNHGPLADFNDDMGWLALALLDLREGREETDVVVRPLLQSLRGRIAAAHTPLCGGGIAWAGRHPGFKNVPATGPAIILAARCSRLFDDPGSLALAVELGGWLTRTLVDDGVVWDGTHARAGGRCELEKAEYTYLYGLVVGASVALYDVTGEQGQLVLADRVARVGMARMTDPDSGTWRAEGPGDGGLFKGIFARYLADLAIQRTDTTLAALLVAQGDALWEVAGPAGRSGADWSAVPLGAVSLSEQLSGVLLFEACARLGRAGLLA